MITRQRETWPSLCATEWPPASPLTTEGQKELLTKGGGGLTRKRGIHSHERRTRRVKILKRRVARKKLGLVQAVVAGPL